MGTQSHLPVIRLPELQTFRCHICPDVGGECCGNGEDIAEYLGVLHLATQARFPWSCGPRGDMKRRFFLCHMVPPVPKAQKRNLLSDPVFHQEDLFAPATFDAARHAARDVSFYQGSQSRPSMSPGTTQWRPFSSSSASRGRTQSSSAPAPPQRSQALFLDAFYAPEEIARSPEGVFRG